jgi:hypothetical protein
VREPKKGVVALIGGKQPICADLDILLRFYFFLFLGQVLPYCVDQSVVLSLLQENCHYATLPFSSACTRCTVIS